MESAWNYKDSDIKYVFVRVPGSCFKLGWTTGCQQRWAECEIFQYESDSDSQKLNPIQSWSAKFWKLSVRPSPDPPMWNHVFYFASWGKIDTVFLAFPTFNMAIFILLSEAKALLFCLWRTSIDEIGQVTKMILLQLESPNSKCPKLHTVEASNNWDHLTRSFHSCLFAPHRYGFYRLCASRSWWFAHSTQRQPRGCKNIPSFLQQAAPIAHSFCESCIWHELPIRDERTVKFFSPSPVLCAKFLKIINPIQDWSAHVKSFILFCLMSQTNQRWARIRTGSDCNFFDNWRTRTGSDWENFCCFNVIILKISKIMVVIWFHRFAKW